MCFQILYYKLINSYNIDFDNNTYKCNNVNHNLEQQEEEMKNGNQLPIISKEDLDIVAHIFYLRKKEMEKGLIEVTQSI